MITKKFPGLAIALLFVSVNIAAFAGFDEGDVEHHGPAYPGESYGVQKLAENVYAYIGQGGGSNSGFIITAEGVIVIDARDDPELAQSVVTEIRKITSAPIRYLIDTHHHGDHTGGNVAFEEEGAIIISHKACRVQLQSNKKRALPDLTFDKAVQLYLGDQEIQIHHFGWAHTKGDVVIFLPDAGVLFAGDVLFAKKFPWVGDGNLDGWLTALDKAKAINAKAIVPGHGVISTNADVEALIAFFNDIRNQTLAQKNQGKTLDAAKSAVDFSRYIKDGWGGEFFDSLPPKIVAWMWE